MPTHGAARADQAEPAQSVRGTLEDAEARCGSVLRSRPLMGAAERAAVKSIILWYQVPHLRVALSDSGRSPHRRRAGRDAHGRSCLSPRPCYGWLPTRAYSEFVNESPSRVRRGRRSPVLQTCSLTAAGRSLQPAVLAILGQHPGKLRAPGPTRV